jgi:hypothetical protein
MANRPERAEESNPKLAGEERKEEEEEKDSLFTVTGAGEEEEEAEAEGREVAAVKGEAPPGQGSFSPFL